eukprot:3577459-Rhodomonas_salina.1
MCGWWLRRGLWQVAGAGRIAQTAPRPPLAPLPLPLCLCPPPLAYPRPHPRGGGCLCASLRTRRAGRGHGGVEGASGREGGGR